MANRLAPAYGLDRQLQLKQQEKFDAALEEEVRAWICEMTGAQIAPKPHCLEEALKDGTTLCNLMNKLKPGSVGKVNKMKMPFMMMENIAAYLSASRAFGIREADLFQTVDLYEAQNMNLVIQNLSQLARLTGRTLKGTTGGAQPPAQPAAAPSQRPTETENITAALEAIGGADKLKTMSPSLVQVLVRDLNNHLMAVGEAPLEPWERDYLVSLAGQTNDVYKPQTTSAPPPKPATPAPTPASAQPPSRVAPVPTPVSAPPTRPAMPSQPPPTRASFPTQPPPKPPVPSQAPPAAPATVAPIADNDPLMQPFGLPEIPSSRTSYSRHSRAMGDTAVRASQRAPEAELTIQLSQVQMQLSELRVSNDRLQRSVNQVSRERDLAVAERDQQMTASRSEITRLRQQLSSVEAKLQAAAAVAGSTSDKDNTIATLNKRLEEALQSAADAKADAKASRAEADSAAAELRKAAATASHKQVAEAEAEVLRYELAKAQATISSLKSERDDTVRMLESERRAWHEQAERTHNSDAAVVSQLQEKCRTLTLELDQQKSQAAAEAQQRMAEAVAEVEAAVARAQTAEDNVVQLKAKLDTVERARAEDVKSAATASSQDNAKLMTRIQSLESDLASANALASQVETLKKDLAASREHARSLESKLTSVQQKLETAERDLARTAGDKTDTESRFQKELDHTRSQLESQNATAIAAKEAECTTLRDRIRDLQSEVDQKTLVTNQLNEQLTSMRKQAQQVSDQVDESAKKHQAALSKLERERDELRQARDHEAMLREEERSRHELLMKNQHGDNAAQSEKQLQALKDQLVKAEQRASELESSVNDLNQVVADLGREKEALKAQLATLEEAKAGWTREQQELERKACAQDVLVDTLRADIQNLQQALNRAEAEANQLRHSASSAPPPAPGAPAPPPPPPAPGAPPPPPPPPAPGAPPPPPPAAAANPRADLMAAIRGGSSLKKVEAGSAGASGGGAGGAAAAPAEAPQDAFMMALAGAMLKRRKDMAKKGIEL